MIAKTSLDCHLVVRKNRATSVIINKLPQILYFLKKYNYHPHTFIKIEFFIIYYIQFVNMISHVRGNTNHRTTTVHYIYVN
jgi:hypothetical protein